MQDAGATSTLGKLPVEILEIISEESCGTMTRPEAEKYREELMAERTVFVKTSDEQYFDVVCVYRYLVLTSQLILP